MPHVHMLKDGQKTGEAEITVSGDHVHKLPNGQYTEPAEGTKTHVHKLPDNSTTPGGPIEPEEKNERRTKSDI